MLRGKVLFAYLLVCVPWGSTYIAIRIGVETIPPLLFGGIRFTTAGLVLLGVMLAAGQRLPATRREWRVLATAGLFILAGGNTSVMVAEQFTPAGVASVFVVVAVVWTAFFEAVMSRDAHRLSRGVMAGLALGLIGTVVLVGFTPRQLAEADWRGPAVLTFGTLCWAFGAVYYKRNKPAVSPYVGAAIEMIVGGVAVLVGGLAIGEGARLHFTTAGVGSLVYLITFGSLIGYTAYNYALTHASPTIVGTYAYVNPVVAVLLAWPILGERIEARTVAGMVIVLGAVISTQFSWGAPAVQRAGTAD